MTDEKKFSVLVVDDEVDNLDLLERILRRDYIVYTATNGFDALDIIEKHPEISLIITDQRMPGMTGVQLLERTVEENRNAIRIILTAYTDVKDLIDAINSGRVYQYITKPWDPDELKLVVKRALESYQLTIQNEVYRRELVKRERMAKELEIAREIQESLWPKDFPKVEDFQLSARSFPANEVGGDLYHYFTIKMEQKLALSVGDVSGKGVPAALYSAVSSGMLRVQSQGVSKTASEVLSMMNDALCADRSETFVCLCCAILDLNDKIATIANSGLSYPIYSTEDNTEIIELDGLPLGIEKNIKYDEKTVSMRKKGDILVLSSDGVTEAMNGANELFGEERLLDVVKNNRHLNANDLLNKIFETVKQFSQNATRIDDITLMVLKNREG